MNTYLNLSQSSEGTNTGHTFCEKYSARNMSSTFHIFTKKIEPDYIEIWNNGTIIKTAGSGFGVELNDKKYIISNAHIAENSHFIECCKIDSSKRYVLTAFNIAIELDLCLLTVADADYQEFWNNTIIFQFSTLYKSGDNINVVGYPTNGVNPSITKGIVNRVMPTLYGKSVLNIAMQVDSTINLGNSGGPVFNMSDEVIGMAYANNTDKNYYVIPTFYIQYYLDTIKKYGTFIGLCDLDIETTSLENVDLHRYYISDFKTQGILIERVNPAGCSYCLLESNDILIKVNEYSIYNDQTICIGEHRVPYWYSIKTKYPGDNVKLTIIRNKKEITVNVTVNIVCKKLIPALSKDISQLYYIFAGLIFMPINFWYLFDMQKLNVNKYKLFNYVDKFAEPQQEIIILYNILQSPINSGYNLSEIRLLKINDTPVINMLHLYNMCEQSKNEFMKFEFENNKVIILDTARARDVSNKISQLYLKVPYTNL